MPEKALMALSYITRHLPVANAPAGTLIADARELSPLALQFWIQRIAQPVSQ